MALSNNRLEALSDGVFAIVLTLLILEIRVPHLEDHSHAALIVALGSVAPKIFSWLTSFFILMVFWVNHHHILSRAKKCDYGLFWLNALVLLAVSFIPFPTAFMGEYLRSPVAVTFFSLVVGLGGFFATLLHWYVVNFLADDQARQEFNFLKILIFGPGLYVLAAVLAWVNIYISYGLLIFIPLYFLLPKQK
ncbi:MAG: DUF1211 domain-containing protein [Candidatus Omnitrophica bacterium]|nr:DUF1211 domain-containing protein [Candidatus Omnitrophota bacterium]